MSDSFSGILSRGLRAAHRSIPGLLLLFLVYGWYQGVGVLVGSALGANPQIFQIQPGQQPPQELFWLMGYGCFSCVWMVVMVFAGPWIAGGILGRLRDRMALPEAAVGSFGGYASAYYGRLLLLTLIYLAIVFVLYLALMLVGMMIAGSALEGVPQGVPMNAEQMQLLNRHPANIAAGVVFGLVLAGLGVLFNLADAGIVIEQYDAMTALGRAWSFITGRFGDACKLFLVYAALGAPIGLLYTAPALLKLQSMPVLAVVAVLIACYFPYMILLDLAFAVSVWLARHPRPQAAASAEPAASQLP